MSTLKEQRQAVNEAAKSFEKELARGGHEWSQEDRDELVKLILGLKEASLSLMKLEQLQILLKDITNA